MASRQRSSAAGSSKIPGIGPITASALVASVGDAKNFKNGRQVAAWLGLVPRQHSSGGKTTLLGISKRGDVYLRTLLIHGARSVIYWRRSEAERADDAGCGSLLGRRNKNIAAVALANKNARIAWALLAHGRETIRRPLRPAASRIVAVEAQTNRTRTSGDSPPRLLRQS